MKVISAEKDVEGGKNKNNPGAPTFHLLLRLNDSHHLHSHAESSSSSNSNKSLLEKPQ